jgi:hypothetical protein
VRAIEAFGESDFFVGIADAIEDWSVGARGSGVQEWLLGHLVRPNDWFFERGALTAAYLGMAGDHGAGALLDAVRSGSMGNQQKVPLMAALTEYTAKGHGWAYRDALLALACDEDLTWQVRWLALECLDHSPGNIAELQPLVEGSDVRVSVGAAATAAVWGTPLGLDNLRNAILDGAVPHELSYGTRAVDPLPGRAGSPVAWPRSCPRTGTSVSHSISPTWT